MAEAKEKTLWVTSMYGFKTKEPLVVITMPGGEMLQMRTAEARSHALQVLECADAAESDAFVIEYLQAKVNLTEEAAAVVLGDFRKWREDHES
jgi:hypothetical protein